MRPSMPKAYPLYPELVLDGGRRPRSRGFFGALCPQLQTLHGEIARASTVHAGPKTDAVSSLRHAEQDGHSGRTRAEDLSFVLALPLSTAVSRLYSFVVVVITANLLIQ